MSGIQGVDEIVWRKNFKARKQNSWNSSHQTLIPLKYFPAFLIVFNYLWYHGGCIMISAVGLRSMPALDEFMLNAGAGI